jgi:selenide,water dikinase
VAAELDHAALPWLPGVRELAEAGQVAGGSRRNLEAALEYATFAGRLDELDRVLACDAQTSGGLLVALPPGRAETFRQACAARDVPAARIGRLAEGPAGSVLVS